MPAVPTPTPRPFNLTGGSGGGGATSNASSLVEVEKDDPSKIFAELTEIGHGNFGAVYYVILLYFSLFSKFKLNIC